MAFAWATALVRDQIDWRGNGLVVREGTQFERAATSGASRLEAKNLRGGSGTPRSVRKFVTSAPIPREPTFQP